MITFPRICHLRIQGYSSNAGIEFFNGSGISPRERIDIETFYIKPKPTYGGITYLMAKLNKDNEIYIYKIVSEDKVSKPIFLKNKIGIIFSSGKYEFSL